MQDGEFGAHNRVLTSWKEIAAYLGKGVRTVQRWEKDFGLPIRRPTSSDKSAIIARTRDLDAWVAMRCSVRGLPDGEALGNFRNMLSIRSSLAVGLSTAQMLRASNAELLSQVKSALSGLHSEILRMRTGIRPAQPKLQVPGANARAVPNPDDFPATGAA